MQLYVNAMLAADLVAAKCLPADPPEHATISNAKVAGYFLDGSQLIIVLFKHDLSPKALAKYSIR